LDIERGDLGIEFVDEKKFLMESGILNGWSEINHHN
jgi:hypothetical protein